MDRTVQSVEYFKERGIVWSSADDKLIPITVELYGIKIYIAISTNLKFVSHVLDPNKEWKYSHSVGFSSHYKLDGATKDTIACYVNVDFVEQATDGNLVNFCTHESIHLANYMFNKIGVKLSSPNDESLCYTAAYIAQHMYQIFKKHEI